MFQYQRGNSIFVDFVEIFNDLSEAVRGKSLRIEEVKMCHCVPFSESALPGSVPTL
jgi:hypothetical protein